MISYQYVLLSTSLGTWKVIRTDTISYSILETHQKRHPSSYLRNLGGFICRDGCRACLSDAYSYALSLYVGLGHVV